MDSLGGEGNQRPTPGGWHAGERRWRHKRCHLWATFRSDGAEDKCSLRTGHHFYSVSAPDHNLDLITRNIGQTSSGTCLKLTGLCPSARFMWWKIKPENRSRWTEGSGRGWTGSWTGEERTLAYEFQISRDSRFQSLQSAHMRERSILTKHMKHLGVREHGVCNSLPNTSENKYTHTTVLATGVSSLFNSC